MDKSITITKNQRVTKFELIQELLKDLDMDLFKQVKSNADYDKFFGKHYTVASKSFKISVKVEEIL